MADEPSLRSSDIDLDLEGTRRAQDRLAEFFARAPDAVREWGRRTARGVPTHGGAPPGVGRGLIARCPAETQRRYDTLLYFEEYSRPQQDHAILVAAACQIVEAELERLLLAPASAIADSLIAALQVRKKDWDQARILEQWAANQKPPTLGTQVTLLLALRRGCEQRVGPVVHFLAEHFRPRYVDLLASKKLATCLDDLRSRFRNPACHGTAAFDAAGYERFVRLALAQRRFAVWDASGPTPAEPDADVGVFHHHLSLSLRPAVMPPGEAPSAGSAVPPARPREGLRALWAMAQDTDQIWPVPAECLPRRGVRPGRRDLGAPQDGVRHGYRPGSQVCLGIEVERDAHLLLLDEGTSGKLYCLCPSWFAPDTRLRAGRTYLPPEGARYPAFPVSGPPGRERLLAVLTEEPLRLDWLPPDPRAGARVLNDTDVETVLARLRSLDGGQWRALATSFDVLA
jgi:hypothetical protein